MSNRDKTQMKKVAWTTGFVAGSLVLSWIVWAWIADTENSITLDRPPQGGDFILNSPKGQFRLFDQRGKVIMIYFGYTFCPDICPTNLALMAQALNSLSEHDLARVQGVFISVDPARDTMDRLADYTDHFHPSIVGVTGSAEAVAEVAKQYGAAYSIVDSESEMGYLVDHSSFTYILAADGALHTILPHAASPSDILSVVRELLAQMAG